MLAYKTVSGTKSYKKLVHLSLQFLAFLFGIVGLWAAWKFHNDKGIDNFYSLHSWLGLACLFFFTIQVLIFLPLSVTFTRKKSTIKPRIFERLVGSWIHDILVSRRFKKQQGFFASMACVFWSLHLCACNCCLCHWPFRESYISSNKQHHFALFCRSSAG